MNCVLSRSFSRRGFDFVLKIAAEKKLLNGRTVGVDSTTLEANSAMRSIAAEAILMGLEPHPELQTQGEMDPQAVETLLQLGRQYGLNDSAT